MPVIFEGYRSGALAGVLGLHMDYYGRQWGLGRKFETKFALDLAEFLYRFDTGRDLFLTAWRDEKLLGSISIDVSGGGLEGARLRWFGVAEGARGTGLGKQLMARAISHADTVTAGPVWLTTFEGLDAARALYERFGFQFQAYRDEDQGQGDIRELVFERPAPSLPVSGTAGL
jgi:GNAT superfamily N-acetyltransferase